MAALQERNEKDIASYETEMKDLRRKIDHDDRIKEFMLVKSDDRAELKAEEAAKKEAMKGQSFLRPLPDEADKSVSSNFHTDARYFLVVCRLSGKKSKKD